MKFDGPTLATATGGVLRHVGAAGAICTDSRNLRPGDWFLALEGERFDGHAFLPAIRAAGCAGAVVRYAPADWDRGCVLVPDTLVALQDIARHVRRTFTGPVVGITGTAGKTTTRAMTALAIGAMGDIHATMGNLNNHIGVPLTLLATEAAAAWVIEMGMSGFGEIALLQDIAAPTVRLITNVGAAHLEGVGSIEGVARAKGELFAGARPGDTCCINLDDPRIAALPIPAGVRRITYGQHPDADVRQLSAWVNGDSFSTGFRVRVGDTVVSGEIAVPGLHLATNATAALAVAAALGLDLADAAQRLSTYAPVGMRQRLETLPSGIRVINDAYNANPLSTRASLDTLAAVTGVRRVALLGDMLELGPTEHDLHVEVLSHAVSLDLDQVGVAGPRFQRAHRELLDNSVPGAEDVVAADNANVLAQTLGSTFRQGDLVLLKGSRGLAMETVLDHLPAPTATED